MDIFTVGLITLLVFTLIFYAIFFGFIFYWHLKTITVVIVPLLFTFEFFIAGFFVVAIIAILLQYLPRLLKLTGT